MVCKPSSKLPHARLWRSKRHPETAARIRRLRDGTAQLERLAPMLQKWSGELVGELDVVAVAAAEASAAQAREAAG